MSDMKPKDKMEYFSSFYKPRRKKGSLRRLIASAIVFLAQIVFLVWSLYSLNIFGLSVYIIFQIISSVTVIRITYNQQNPSYKIAWITLILIIPFLGLLFYVMWGRGRYPRKVKKHIPLLSNMTIPLYKWNHEVEARMQLQYPSQGRISNYLTVSGFPIYDICDVMYFSSGEEYFEKLLEELKKAKSFIFMEYFIISKGVMWESIHSILAEKSAEGVEINILYDDFGCISTIPPNFEIKLKREGINVRPFNKVKPVINNFYINYRNHQKMCIIDGNVAFTGGINLADEYINEVTAFGYWKDSGVFLKGDPVWSMTVIFMQMWTYASPLEAKDITYLKYMPADMHTDGSKGFIQPFCDGPFTDPNKPAEFLYMQMINNANDYIYLTTPYLVLDNEMVTALSLAALSGVDVRIITPGIPDKKYVYLVTQSFYGVLLKSGVRIYEYTPGFMHSKLVVADDETAVVGTVNMDFRSFYLHFENGVWMCGSSCVMDIKNDFLNTLTQCREVDYDSWMKRPRIKKVCQTLLYTFSPML